MQIVSNVEYAKIAKMSAAEQEDAAARLWRDKTAGKAHGGRTKELTIIVGQPGSGKSSLARHYLAEKPDMTTIGGDDVLAYHPRLFQMAQIRPPRLNSKALDCYDNPVFRRPQDNPLNFNAGERYIEDFAYDAFIQTTCRLLKEGYGVVLDMLPGDEAKVFAALGRRLGYNVHFVAASVPKEISRQNIINRYEEGQERFLRAQKGLAPQTAENVPHTYNKLRQAPEDIETAREFMEQVVAEGFSLQVVNPLNCTFLAEGKAGAAAYISELSRPLTRQEQDTLYRRGTEIVFKQEKRGASRYDKYVAAVARSYLGR